MNLAVYEEISRYILEKFDGEFNDNDRQFFKRVFDMAPARYEERLQALGFDTCDSVLDAGCGFGQWALCLSGMCRNVQGVESSALRVKVANAVFQRSRVAAKAVLGVIQDIPLPNASVDGVFCYGTLFCAPWKEVLAEFSRVLKPSGRLYFSANDIGYVLNMWVNRPNKCADFDPREVAAHTFVNTVNYEKSRIPPQQGQILIAPQEAREELESLDFDVLEVLPEGTINVKPGEVDPIPFFQSEYLGLPGCYEVLAIKKS